MAEKGVAAVTGGVRDGWKASCRGDVLVPFDLQQLPLTFVQYNLPRCSLTVDVISFKTQGNVLPI